MLKDATYWSREIREKRISKEELLKETNKRIKQLNPLYNAIVEVDFDQSLRELQQMGNESDQPFYGVPICLKSLGQSKKGWPDTAGSHILKNVKSHVTNNFVRKIEKLGFVSLGQTNAPEFGFKNITDSKLYGTTKNVWNRDYHAGGSSGGAASALASGMFSLAAASDGGGSIRIPASFSGVIGLKPTRGSMPTGPNGWRSWQGASINFALTQSMRDTETLFYAMKGVSKASPFQAPFYSEKPHSMKNKKFKIAWTQESPISSMVSSEAKNALKKTLSFLEAQGHELEEVTYPLDGRRLMTSYYLMNGAETDNMIKEIENGTGGFISQVDVEPMSWAIYQYGQHIQASEYIESLGIWDDAAFTMEQLFETYDLFLTPTVADSAPRIEEDLQSPDIRQKLSMAHELSKKELEELVYLMFEKSLEITPFTQLANLTGQPAISLPTYVTEKGLPLGIQFMASKGKEAYLFEIGKQYEGLRQFYLPAPLLER